MNLLAPGFLLGLLAVGLPVWLHLLRQHKTEPTPFSSLMFFEKRTQSSVKYRRLKYLALLASRAAMLVLAALAFANPSCRRPPEAIATGSKLNVVAIDRSFSMRGGEALARAKREAQAVVNGMRAGDRGQIVALSGRAELLTQPTQDKAELLAALQAIEPGDARGSYGELSQTLRSIAAGARQPLEVHLFSDLQKSGLPPGFTDLKLGPATKLVPHPLAAAKAANWAVESVIAPRSVGDPKRIKIQATVAGYGTPAAKKAVQLMVNGRQAAAKLVDVGASGRGIVEFAGVDAPYGWSRCEVRVDGGDALEGDDTFRFGLERADARRILFVRDARQQRSAFYFRNALDAIATANFGVDEVEPEKTGGVDPAKFAFTVLNDPGELPETFVEALKRYVAAGGNVWIAAGATTAGRAKVPLLEAAVSGSRYATRTGERFLTVIKADATHPTVRRADRLEGVKFFQAVKTEAGDLRVLARLNDDTPLLMERSLGNGKILYFASTFDNISNDLPIQPAFVPFVEQTALYLAGSDERPSYAVVDSFVELRTGTPAPNARMAAVEVLDPKGQRVLSLQDSVKAQTVRVTQEGFWEIGRENGRRELVAVNADRRESDLAVLPEETVKIWQNMSAGAAANGEAGASEETKPLSFWWYLALLLAAAAVVESVLAVRYLKTDRAA
jgi:hypothetical protein